MLLLYVIVSIYYLRRYAFRRRTPSTPSMVNPPYCAVLASPNSTTHSTLFRLVLMGRSICAKEST